MTVATTTREVVLETNGATTVFPFNFKVLNESHLTVERRVASTGVVDKTYTSSEYTLTGVGNDSGSVEITPALAAGYEIIITRTVPYKQDLDIVNQGGFYPESVEAQLDRIVMQIQQLATVVGRSLVVAPGDLLEELGSSVVRANKYIAFDSNGQPLLSNGTGTDAGLRTDLGQATPAASGAEIVGTAAGGNLEDTDRRQRIIVGETHINLHSEYGFSTAQTNAQRTASLQQAFNEAPLGAILHMGAGQFTVNDEINITRQVHMEGHGGEIISVPGSVAKSGFKVRLVEAINQPAGGAATDARGSEFRNVRLTVQGDCLHGVDITHESGQSATCIANHRVMWRNGKVSIPDAAAGRAVYIAGLVTQKHIFEGLDIVNGVHLDGCADGCRFLRNTVFGVKEAFLLELVGGAFKTEIKENILVSRDGALLLRGGSQVDFMFNQIEQSASYGPNQASVPASVRIVGTDYDCVANNICFNNFGGGDNVRYNIYLQGTTKKVVNTFIDGNVFNRGAYTWGGAGVTPYDVLINDAGVEYTRIGPNNQLRGVGAGRGSTSYGTYPTIAANTVDPADVLAVADSGTGTYGIWKAGSTLALQNGFTTSTFRFKKLLDDILVFQGALGGAATLTVGTAIGTLPVGFRPKQDVWIPVMCNASDARILKITAATGVISVSGTTALSASNVQIHHTIPIKGRDSYTPGY